MQLALEVFNMEANPLSSIEKMKRRVHKRYPGAYVVNNNGWYVCWNGKNLNEIFLLDNAATEEEAWQQATITANHQQYINRTHPLKSI